MKFCVCTEIPPYEITSRYTGIRALQLIDEDGGLFAPYGFFDVVRYSNYFPHSYTERFVILDLSEEDITYLTLLGIFMFTVDETFLSYKLRNMLCNALSRDST